MGARLLTDATSDDDVEFERMEAGSAFEIDRIASPFDPLEIKIGRRLVTIEQVVKRIRYKEIELAPDFQRRARIWDPIRKSRLIESILLRIPLPVFYVASDAHDYWRVVDGLQRLTTIFDFIDVESEHNFRLHGLEYLSDYEGWGYSQLPRGLVRRIDETELNINIIESGTPDEVMFNIFKRLNTGGLSLNGQEIRHALNPGLARSFLLDLSQSQSFLTATNGSVKDDRMGARELVLRFLAFRIRKYTDYTEGDLDGFLNDAMRQINEMSESSLRRLRESFETAMNRAYIVFGDDAFRKRFYADSHKSPINKALFEAWSVAFSQLSPEIFSVIQDRKSKLRDISMVRLNTDADFLSSISIGTGGRQRVLKRFSTVENMLREVTL